MRVTIRGLRFWIVATAVLLLAALALFIGYARYKAHRLVLDIPGKLGGKIESTSEGFTYSQSVKGRTAFTIHAAKAVQFKGGTSATLHDVVITLYGAQGDRNDRISGSEFDYDQKAGIATARGEVQIDLQGGNLAGAAASQAAHDGGPAATTPPSPAQQTIHVKTSGLVFNQKTQVAATSQFVEFSTPKASGHSTGATYDVQKGLLVLDSAVELTTDRDGGPVLVHASHAEFLRGSLQAFLLNPVSDYQSRHTSADQAIVYFRQDGSAEHIDAKGHIHMTTDDGQQMTAQAATILLDQRGQPQRADASGGLNFISHGEHEAHGNAVEGTLTFNSDGTLHHAQARNAVSFVDQQRGLGDDPQGSATRELRAAQVDIDFLPGEARHAVADKMLAVGGATAVLHTIRTKSPSQNTTIKGDQLLASLRDGKTITGLHGNGHTSVLDVAANGATNLSSGDTLQVNFAPPPDGNHPASAPRQQSGTVGARADSSDIESAVQEGNVVMVQTPGPDSESSKRPTSSPAPSPTRATARRAEYTGATQLLRLTGSPRINDGSTDLTADSIDYRRDAGTASATGNIKATYLQPRSGRTPGAVSPGGIGGQGPTHIVSSTAVLDQARGQAVFRGQARLWQGANSVAAPVIELQRDPETLKAYGQPAANGAVFTVIATSAGAQQQPGVFRVHSRELLYSDVDHKATFTGAVSAEDSNGVVHCDQVEAFLTAAPELPRTSDAANATPPLKAAGSAAGLAESGQSRVDRIVATGHVVLQQPGRRGSGEKLVYTAGDGKYVLTGTSATPPHLYDQAHGAVSGEALIFDSRDDSVSVTGGRSKAVTDTRTVK